MYTVKLFGTPLVSFEMANQGKSFEVEVASFDANRKDLFPLSWEKSRTSCCSAETVAQDLTRWLKQRTIPSNRAHAASFLVVLA